MWSIAKLHKEIFLDNHQFGYITLKKIKLNNTLVWMENFIIENVDIFLPYLYKHWNL